MRAAARGCGTFLHLSPPAAFPTKPTPRPSSPRAPPGCWAA